MQQEILKLQQTVGPEYLDRSERSSAGGDDQDEPNEDEQKKAITDINTLTAKIRQLQQQRDEKIDACMKDTFDKVDTDMR